MKGVQAVPLYSHINDCNKCTTGADGTCAQGHWHFFLIWYLREAHDSVGVELAWPSLVATAGMHIPHCV